MNRKEFMKASGLGLASLYFAPAAFSAENKDAISFGVITDLHHDIMHDSMERLDAFVREMNRESPDFIIQLGDFCVPKKDNKSLLDTWNKFGGKKFHVIGNHDTDGGYSRDQVVEFWEAQGKYYSFDQNGFHFVVLDGNEHNESPDRPAGYARYISKEQLDWLAKDLDATELPTVVFCHQGLDNDLGGLENGTTTRYTLEQANESAGFQKVVLVLSGHHHQDYYNHINGIHYVQINSASYQWLGDNYKTIRYSEKVDESHPWIKYTVPYKEPIWASVRLSTKGKIEIKGKSTKFVGPSPKELGVNMAAYAYPIVPYISDRQLKF
ncbi:hypothetical protein GCM10028791_21920 [Echinicola sediminis]